MENIEQLGNRVVRKVYLITYSRANEQLCASRDAFANMIIEAFRFDRGVVRPLHWAVCREPHEGGGFHFHMCICLSNNKRWLPVVRSLAERGIHLNFQQRNDVYNYVGAYIYVCKSDRNVLHSIPHPDLTNVTQFRTSAASATNQRRAGNGGNGGNRQKKLTNLNVMQIIRSKGIKDDTSLLALADENFQQGHTALMEFIANNPERKYKELITKVWKIANAQRTVRRAESTRMQRMQQILAEPCIGECVNEKTWFKMAMDVLQNNGVNAYVFSEAVRKLLKDGRQKGNNILITGPRNCAKTFLLKPLTKVFNCFTNPSSGTYAFVGIQNKEVAFLNDLRYNSLMLPWQDFLNLLEGMEVHIPTPKTHFSEDIELTSDIPFFATSIAPIMFVGKSTDVSGENAMMECRWKEFKFTHSIPVEDQRHFPPCVRCFAELIFLGCDMD